MSTTHVHVHLFYGADPRRFRAGENVGCLYGYHYAESAEMALSYTVDHPESKLMSYARRAMKALIGFDFIHTFRNRASLLAADVVWTHTEREFLAASLLLLLKGRKKSPLLVAQSVWLLDIWPTLSLPKKLLFRFLLGRADTLTTLSTVNARLVQKYWNREATTLYYGVSTDDFPVTPTAAWRPHAPLRIAAIGNDRDRDWQTLLKAFENDPAYQVHVATRRRVTPGSNAKNILIAPVHGLSAQRELYAWADVIVVPLHPNQHASGITVVLEAVALGKPVVATAGGGLEDYFSDNSVWYVPVHDVSALRACVASLAASPERTTATIRSAQEELVAKDFTTRGFARQHVDLTNGLLQRAELADSSLRHTET